jgi:hypothetical protein
MTEETTQQAKNLNRSEIEDQIGSWLVAAETTNFRDPQGGGGNLHVPKGTQYKIVQYDIHSQRLGIELENGVKIGLSSGCFPEEGINIED